MKTVSPDSAQHSNAFRHLAFGVAAVLFTLPASALNPPEDEDSASATSSDPIVATLVDQDPYFSFLTTLDERSPGCAQLSTTLRRLLSDRELLVRRFLAAPAAQRAEIAPKISELDAQIAEMEIALETEYAVIQPADAPGYTPPPPLDLERLRNQARRSRRAVMPPPRAMIRVPELPAPAHERAYVEYLGVCAGDSRFAQKLTAATKELFAQRRELAWRHAHASASERFALESTIRLVSHQLRESAQAAAAGSVVTGW